MVSASLAGPLDLSSFRSHVRSSLGDCTGAIDAVRVAADYESRVDALRTLQRSLHDVGIAQVGWPTAVGGAGGDIRHRAVLYEELARAGAPERSVFEHLEILVPPVVERWTSPRAPEAFQAFLRGDELWCQGFSEPDAGSDIAGLRTVATPSGDGFVLDGHKVWTSWVSTARWCFVLARTGRPDERHRGLTLFAVDLETAGVEHRSILQANGTPELGEVVLSGCWVPAANVVGEVGGGWDVAMHILACERSAFGWMRHLMLLDRLRWLSRSDGPVEEAVGAAFARILALRTVAAEAIEVLASGEHPGPRAAIAKVLLTDAEQHLYAHVHRDLNAGRVADDAERGRLTEELLFARAISIYGGTRQIQLETISRHVLRLPS